jgi:hypothetical protein
MAKNKKQILKPNVKDFESIVIEGCKLDEPERTKYFESLIKKCSNRDEVKRLQIILKRIKVIIKHVNGFVPEENTKYQNEIIGKFYHKLDDKYFIEYLRDQKRRLEGLCIEIKREMDSLPIYEYGPISANRYIRLQPYYEYNSRLRDWLGEIIERFAIEKLHIAKEQDKPIKITNDMVAGFCSLVNSSELPYKRTEDDTAETFCQRICELYKLPYKTRVRIAFSPQVQPIIADKIKKAILPNIPKGDQEKILKVIDSLSK